MNGFLAALLALHLFAAPAPTKCESLFFGELPENGAILDVAPSGLIVLVNNDNSVGVMRWMSGKDNEVLTKQPRPRLESVKMELFYDDGSALQITVIACNGTLCYSAFRIWTFQLDQVPYFAA